MPVPLGELEAHATAIGRRIAGTLPPSVGFALFVFDFGTGGNLTYISNAERATLLNALKEFQVRLALDNIAPPGGPDQPGALD